MNKRTRIFNTPVGVGVDHTPGSESIAKLGVLRVVRMFRLVLGVQVIEIPIELIEAVARREELILVTKVVLAELSGGVPLVLEQLCDRRVLLLQTEVGGHSLVLANVDGEVYALDDRCSHQEFPLSDGELDGASLECIYHGATFDVCSGRATGMPAIAPVKTYEVEVRDQEIYVQIDG